VPSRVAGQRPPEVAIVGEAAVVTVTVAAAEAAVDAVDAAAVAVNAAEG